MLAKFLNANKRLSLRLEKKLGYFPQQNSVFDDMAIMPFAKVADIGGGKKPHFTRDEVEKNKITYVGIDIDPVELALAPPHTYDYTRVVDIESADTSVLFDIIICRFTLEHVKDSERAIAGLLSMLEPGGIAYISLPSRYAIFAKLNRLLPERLKKLFLGKIYPSKVTDGFPAYYNKASPHEFRAIVEANSGDVVRVNKIYFSGYFTFFLPLHIVWRLASLVQMAAYEDYCESFELVITKA